MNIIGFLLVFVSTFFHLSFWSQATSFAEKNKKKDQEKENHNVGHHYNCMDSSTHTRWWIKIYMHKW